jgi:hypothetical protein
MGSRGSRGTSLGIERLRGCEMVKRELVVGDDETRIMGQAPGDRRSKQEVVGYTCTGYMEQRVAS